MKIVRVACNLCLVLLLIMILPSNVFASLTKEQAEGVAMFATTFIEKGNERRDENGYPLLVYALSNNWNTCIEIRRSGYLGELYHIKKNNYHMRNGKYLDLGMKWCMDCGDFISYVYKTTLGLDMYLEETEDPWHIKDMYADANKYENSEYFEFIYKNVPISKIDESKLELGDVIIRLGSRENHGLIYVGNGMQSAHASRNAIKYSKNPPILGFEVVQLDKFYKRSTIVSIIRVKDGAVNQNKEVNSTIVWPDTGEEEALLGITKKVYTVFLENKTFEISSLDETYIEEVIENNLDIKEDISITLPKKVFYYLEEPTELYSSSNYVKDKIVEWILNEVKKLLIQAAK